jgi:hypothetical protein
MKTNSRVIGIITILFLCACTRVAFESAPRVRLNEKNPERIRAHFANALPLQFQRVDTLTFQYGGRRMSAIGITDVDMEAESFKVVGLNPLGIKLFDLSGDMRTINSRFVAPAFSQHKNFAQSIAQDIRRIYFHRIPASSADVSVGKYQAVYQNKEGHERLTYIFSGEIPRLTSKQLCRNNNIQWRVQYFEYVKINNHIHPGKIYLKNHKYNYQLTIVLKEIRS